MRKWCCTAMLLGLIGSIHADEALRVTPASGLFFGPSKTLGMASSGPLPSIRLEQLDNGFKTIQRRETDRLLAQSALRERLTEVNRGEGWQPQCRVQSQLDDAGRIILERRAWWTGAAWVPSSRVRINYQDGHPVSQVSELWDEQSSEWVPDYRLDSQWEYGQNLLDTHYEWSDPDGDGTFSWTAFALDIYDYDAQGHAVSWQHSELQEDGQWLLCQVTDFQYDDQGRLTSQAIRSRLDETWALENFSRTTYVYDAQGQVAGIRESNWNGAAWEDTYKTVVQVLPDGTVSRLKMRVDDQRFVQADTPVILTNPTG